MQIILTFPTIHQVLSAEKALRLNNDVILRCRTTPTPPGLSSSICSMSLEILDPEDKEAVLSFLQERSLGPSGVYELG